MATTEKETPTNRAEELNELARYAKALAHPIRLLILEMLSNQSCCYTGELVDVLPIAQSTVSQHLKELKEAGLIQGNIEPPKVRYCINQANWDRARELFDRFFRKERSGLDGE